MACTDQTINSCKGEILEGKLSLLLGIPILMIGVVYVKWDIVPYARIIST